MEKEEGGSDREGAGGSMEQEKEAEGRARGREEREREGEGHGYSKENGKIIDRQGKDGGERGRW